LTKRQSPGKAKAAVAAKRQRQGRTTVGATGVGEKTGRAILVEDEEVSESTKEGWLKVGRHTLIRGGESF